MLAIAEVLSNPRKLKNILRKAYGLWNESLKGEIHLFDLLLYCASIEDAELKNLIKGSASEILEGKFNGKKLFSSPLLDAMAKKRNEQTEKTNKADLVINLTDPQGQRSTIRAYINQQSKTVDIDQSPKMTTEAGEQNARAQLAFYILNGDLPDNIFGRNPRCQPFIEENGKSESAYRKYKSALRRGCLGVNISSDQEFLKNYVKASAVICDQQALKFCLDSIQKDWGISKSLLKNMTIQYFSSVSELHQFLYNAIVVADEKYVGTFHSALEVLILFCFEVMNFDGSGGEQHSSEFQRKLIAALKQLDEHKHYSYLLRILSFILWNRMDNHFSQVVTAVIETMFTHQLSVRMGLCFRDEEHKGAQGLQYEYIHFLPALKEAQHLVTKKTLYEVCRSFLVVIGMKLQDDPKILSQFAQRYPDPLSEIKQAIENALRDEALESIELNAWQELLRVLPDTKNTDNSQPQDK